jgi:hypothetical protein
LVELPINTSNGDAEDAKPELVLRQYELADNLQKYRALSYVWGGTTKRNLISLNGQDFWVTDSLMSFLKRPRTETFYYWIDAISLDQDDEEEKASQIPRMKEIYENAAYVFADLGPASEDEELAVDHILEIARVVLPFLEKGLEKFAAEDDLKNLDEEDMENLTLALQRPVPEVMDIVGCPLIEPYEEKVWSRIGGFFYRPYWTRAWIMQEATAIEYPALWYGNKTCNLQEAWTAALASRLWGNANLGGTIGRRWETSATSERKRRGQITRSIESPSRRKDC